MPGIGSVSGVDSRRARARRRRVALAHALADRGIGLKLTPPGPTCRSPLLLPGQVALLRLRGSASPICIDSPAGLERAMHEAIDVALLLTDGARSAPERLRRGGL